MPGGSPTSRAAQFNAPFFSALDSASTKAIKDDPNYYALDPQSLVTTSTIHSFSTGTGSSIYTSLAPLLESTSYELILVTCFWARSPSLDTLNEILLKLSDKAVRRGSGQIIIRLCFSSLSLFQKLFHTQSVNGQSYPSSVWAKTLGLPDPSALPGLDIRVKSVFLLPFSVMHPKFMIVDRRTVVLPSCNISWEEWFEGCITCSGPIVHQFVHFYTQFWERNERRNSTPVNLVVDLQANRSTRFSSSAWESEVMDIPTVFLPGPHRKNPAFQPFAAADKTVAPPTPLNTFILTLLARAEKSVQIQTPNLTSPPVLSALLKALARGINVRILTSEKLMVLEQLVTAGTTTNRCIKKLIRRYEALSSPNDEEASIALPRPGRLSISYFSAAGGPKKKGEEFGEPQQSHLKMMVVDDEVLVLGSGNLDRASWYTSQELGVAFFDRLLVERVKGCVEDAMKVRTRVVY
ncbi:hypothetical protein BCR34DRAFT_495344 [Clohesyomyces aquaticus]|uniref:PLD phosphodiesterase domain-containing protein n=1 Tax=Clohesyomyces aquaticus TaxID=1231657 RepID=A0A1Y1YNT4_9PLEO|nr:hypothetical protein BCR34DRAFT_495344 [Clohesyomyces aquaticus]